MSCCPADNLRLLLHVVTFSICKLQCGVTCHTAGMLANGTCVHCSRPLTTCGANDPPLDVHVVYGDERRTGCRGQQCLLCDGMDLADTPPNATIHASNNCGYHYTDAPLTLTNSRIDPYYHLTLIVDTKVTLTGHALTTQGSLTITGAGSLELQVDGDSFDHDMCALTVVGDMSSSINVTIEVDIVVTAMACGLGVFPDTGRLPLEGRLTFEGISTTSDDIFYAAAIANIVGSLEYSCSKTNASIIVLETHGGALSTQSCDTLIPLSKMLDVFGTTYEIEYYDPDGALFEAEKSTWLATTNTVLIVAATILGGTLLST